MNDSLNPRRPVKIHDISFYPSNSSYKIMYKKFYFPLTNIDNSNSEDSLYTYNQGKYNTNYINEFEYYPYWRKGVGQVMSVGNPCAFAECNKLKDQKPSVVTSWWFFYALILI